MCVCVNRYMLMADMRIFVQVYMNVCAHMDGGQMSASFCAAGKQIQSFIYISTL